MNAEMGLLESRGPLQDVRQGKEGRLDADGRSLRDLPVLSSQREIALLQVVATGASIVLTNDQLVNRQGVDEGKEQAFHGPRVQHVSPWLLVGGGNLTRRTGSDCL